MNAKQKLLTECFLLGVEGFTNNITAACLDAKFMSLVPTDGLKNHPNHKIFMDMMKAYYKGWTSANLLAA